MEKVYIGKQQIQNKSGKVIGYELLFRGDGGFVDNITSHLVATSKVILNILTYIDYEKIIGADKRAFINVDQDVIFSGILDLLNPDYFVIELMGEINVNERLIKSLGKLKKAGFQLAIDDFICNKEILKQYIPILSFIDYIKFDVREIEKSVSIKFLNYFKNAGKEVIVKKIESKEEFSKAIENEYNYYQGKYLKKVELIETEIPSFTQRSVILNLISLLKKDQEVVDLESFIKKHPELIYSILTFINSPLIGLQERIQSIRQAITLLGRRQLIKWLLIYMYSENDSKQRDLLVVVLSRTMLMEKMASNENKEKAFLVGLFSLMDVLCDTPLEVILRGVFLDKDILLALETRWGELGVLLEQIELEEKKKLKDLIEDNFNLLNIGDLLTVLEKSGVKTNTLIEKIS